VPLGLSGGSTVGYAHHWLVEVEGPGEAIGPGATEGEDAGVGSDEPIGLG
jgi:hypothetical protein